MHVLVTYGSKRGGTAGLARVVAEVLRAENLVVELVPASWARSPDEYDAVVVGGALYLNRWHRHARRYVSRWAATLRRRPVWFFSSGPLDFSASTSEIPPTPQVEGLMQSANVRGHKTFGGRLDKNARGLLAHAMAKTRSGDWRDLEQVRAWAKGVAADLWAIEGQGFARPPPPRLEPARGLLATTLTVLGLSAMVGGAALMATPSGAWLGLSRAILAHTPFESFFVPGLVLAGVVGLTQLFAARLVWRNDGAANGVAFVAGGVLAGWMVVQMLMLRTMVPLQLLTAVLGLLIQSLAAWRFEVAKGTVGQRRPRPGGVAPVS